jgi:hypothetical protein
MKIAFQTRRTKNMKQPVKPQPAAPSNKAPEKKPQAPAAPQKKSGK